MPATFRSLLVLSLLVLACRPGGCARRRAEPRPASTTTIEASPTAPIDVPPSLPPPIPAPPDVGAPPSSATRSRSGLASRVLEPGTGTERPRSWDRVRVHYTGWTTDGRMFDSSVVRGTPSDLQLDRVVPGFREGVCDMVVGETRRLWVPAALAYDGAPGRPAGMLVFDVRLLGIDHLERPHPAPSDLARPPSGSECLASGLCSRVLRRGRGQAHPAPTSRVTVAFRGWTAEGRPLGGTADRGEPSHLLLGGLMPGLAEGLSLMVEGEERRLWVPAALAGGEQTMGGTGPVVYDVELIAIDAP